MKILLLVMALFISVNNGIVQERTVVRNGHKIIASVEEYRVGTFEPISKYVVDVKQRRRKVTVIDWSKKK